MMNEMTLKRVYLDYAATTPVDERVLGKMLPFWSEHFGNPSSVHWLGQHSEQAIESAREQIANFIHSNPEEIIFTGCGSESDNLALRGMAHSQRKLRDANHILISPVEHPAVLQTAKRLTEEEGFELEFLPVDFHGMVDPDDLKTRIHSTTALVSVVYGNNEIGTINPIHQIGRICQEFGVPLHSDAVQAAAYLDIDVENDKLDLLSLGAHKLYGPKGVGALYVRNGWKPVPILTGGKQENGYRAGTSNVPLIVGFAEAVRLSDVERAERSDHVRCLRDLIIQAVLAGIPGSYLTGHPVDRLPNHASFVFDNLDGNHLVAILDAAGYCCSSGSACKSGNPQPSEILLGIGLPRELALGSLRVTVGKDTTKKDVMEFLEVLPEMVSRARRNFRV